MRELCFGSSCFKSNENGSIHGQLEHGCWQASTWLSWPAWTWLLTGLFMHVGTDCSWLDERTDLNNVVGNHHDKSTAMFIHGRTCCQGMMSNSECYNNHELGCCITTTMNLVVVSSQVLHVLTYANNPYRFAKLYMLKHDWTILLFYQSCSIMLTVLLQGCWANNPVIACDIFTRVP